MLPFASALAIASLGQTLVVMQGGIDLFRVAGGFSLYVVIVTKYPAGDNSRLWAAIGIAVLAAIAAGLLNGFLIGRMRLNPIVATLGTNALLFGVVLGIGRHPDHDHSSPGTRRGRDLARDPGARVLRRGHHSRCRGGRQAHAPGPSLRRGRGKRDGGSYFWPRRADGHQSAAYLWAQLLDCLAAILHAGIRQPANGL